MGWFRCVQLDSQSGSDESARTLEATTGWTEADYRGRLVLDAGVGAGRFAEVVADHGGEVVGVDLSRAIDAAYQNIGRRPNADLVQADIMAMPFREGTFDLAYSIGVLHHTPIPSAPSGAWPPWCARAARSPSTSTRAMVRATGSPTRSGG